MKAQKRLGISLRIAFCYFALHTCPSSHALEFEVEGTAFLKIHGARAPALAGHPTNTFKAYVKDCQWLIEVNYPGRDWEHSIKWQVGSADGHEIYELRESIPFMEGRNPPANAQSLIDSLKLPTVYAATIVSNAVHINPDDSAVSGQLWQIFASSCYFSTLQTNRITPSFNSSLLPFFGFANPPMRADWTFLNGQSYFLSRIDYPGPGGFPNARYEVLEKTNISGIIIPTRIIFEQFGRSQPEEDVTREPKVTRSVMVSVHSVRSTCSITNFSPSLNRSVKVTDYRPSGPRLSYTTDRWMNLEEARKLSRDTQKAVASLMPKVAPTDSWLILASEVKQFYLPHLAVRLFGHPDPLSQFISDKLPPAVRKDLQDTFMESSVSQPGASRTLSEAIVIEFNKLISEERLYDPALFAGIKLKEDTLDLLSRRGTMNDQVRLNRLLLEDAYPNIIPQSVRVFADTAAPYLILVDFRKKTFQFFDDDGKKGGYIDFNMLTQKDQSNPLKRDLGFSSILLNPQSVAVNVDSCSYEVFLNPFSTRLRGTR